MNDTLLEVSDGTTMNAYVAWSGQPPEKGLIVLQEAFGVNDYIRRMADRFAELGYLAIAPELFHRTHPGFDADYEKREGVAEAMGSVTDAGLITDLKAAYDWLVKESVPEGQIATIGFCMGGRAAYLANATLPLAAAVSFYGGNIVPALLGRAGDLHAPQLFVWGGADAHILSEHRHVVADALTVADKPFVEATFSEAGHGFACDARSSYHAPSAREAFALTDTFLANHLV